MKNSEMLFSLKNTFIAVLLFFAFIGSVFTLISAQISYQNLENSARTEKDATIELIGSLIFDGGSAGRFSNQNLNDLLSILARERGVLFVRFVNLETKNVLASSDGNEVGVHLQALPAINDGGVVNSSSTINPHTIDITFTRGGQMLWMEIEDVFFTGPTLVLITQQIFFILATMLLLGSVVYIVGTNFVTRPLKALYDSIERFGKGDMELRVGDGPPNEVGALFRAFNQMGSRIEQSRERERDASETKTRFFTIASHKLMTPLTGIKWDLTELSSLRGGALTHEQKKFVTHSREKAESLIAMVSSMLEIASADEVAKKYDFQKLNLSEEIELVKKEFRDKARKFQIKIASDLTPEMKEVTMYADKAEIHRVFKSIVDNAITYSNRESAVTIEATLDEHNPGFVECSVSDSGIGIPEDERSHIFDRFYRGKSAMLKDTEGSGLKLFMVKKIIERHGGHVRVTSIVGKGTTFFFTIPTREDRIPKDLKTT